MKKDELRIVFIGMSGSTSLSAISAIVEEGYKVVGILESCRKKVHYTLLDKLNRYCSSLKKYAHHHLIDYRWTDDLNANEIEAFLQNRACNLICVASAGQLLKENIIRIPKFGVLNAHSALLPDYRGPNPHYWMFYDHVLWGGTTLHYIDIGEDTGNIILQERFEIPFGMSQANYSAQCAKNAGRCYRKVLSQLVAGTAQPQKQGQSNVRRARNVSREDFLLDYSSWNVEDAYHFLMGTNGISQIFDDEWYRYGIRAFKKTDSAAGGKFDIQCKDGYIEIERHFDGIRGIKQMVKGVLAR